MRALRFVLMLLVFAFLTVEASQIETASLKELTCSEKLNECEQNLDPIYRQPAELARVWQSCRTSVLEEKLRATQLGLQVVDFKNQVINLKTKVESINQQGKGVMDQVPGVEGLWLAIKENSERLTGAFVSSNDDTLKVYRDVIGRGKFDPGKEDMVFCRLNGINCSSINNGIIKNYELLIDNHYKWKWTNFLLPIPQNAVIGGYQETESGWELLYIGRAVHFEFLNQGFNENYLLVGQVEGKSRKLVNRAWRVTQSNTYYQILVAP